MISVLGGIPELDDRLWLLLGPGRGVRPESSLTLSAAPPVSEVTDACGALGVEDGGSLEPVAEEQDRAVSSSGEVPCGVPCPV